MSLAAVEVPDDHPPWEPSDARVRTTHDLARDPVMVEGFPLLPLGGWATGGSPWELHPKGQVGAGYDSDPDAQRGGSDPDVLLRLVAGFEARLHTRTDWRADLAGNLRQTAYLHTHARDQLGGDANLAIQHAGRLDTWSIDAGWIRDDEALPELPDMVARDRWSTALRGSGERSAWAWSAAAGWSRLDYREDSPYFDRDERDYDSLHAQGSWALLGADGSSLGVEAALEDRRRPADSPANSNRAAVLQGRWRHALAEHSSLDLRLGGAFLGFDDDSFQDPGNDDRRQVIPACSATLRWERDSLAWVDLTLAMKPIDSVVVGANGTRQDLVEVTSRLGLADRLDLVGWYWWSQRTDSSGPSGSDGQKAVDIYMRTGLDYRLRDGVGLRIWAAWQRNGFVNDASDRSTAGVDLALAL